jgi:hypothetical protein
MRRKTSFLPLERLHYDHAHTDQVQTNFRAIEGIETGQVSLKTAGDSGGLHVSKKELIGTLQLLLQFYAEAFAGLAAMCYVSIRMAWS